VTSKPHPNTREGGAALAAVTATKGIQGLHRTPLRTLQDAHAALAAMPDAHGIYARWLIDPSAMPGTPTTPHPNTSAGLLYIGVGPGAPASKRFSDHLREAGKSTLRYTLAALLYERECWTPTWRRDRPVLSDPHAEALSQWMAKNLRVQILTTLQPFDIEPEIVSGMRPPLNRTHNRTHPFYGLVGEARHSYRTAAEQNDGR